MYVNIFCPQIPLIAALDRRAPGSGISCSTFQRARWLKLTCRREWLPLARGAPRVGTPARPGIAHYSPSAAEEALTSG